MKLNKELAEKILSNTDEDCSFFCCNGGIFSNLKQLRDALVDMTDEVFLHHTGQGRNDFSNWIGDCFGDVRLAEQIINLDQKKSSKKIGSRIDYIEKFLENLA